MADMYFNAKGSTHSLRLFYRDDLGVWEALIDAGEYFYFESAENTEIWDLFSLAVSAYTGYRGETETERLEWRSNGWTRGGSDRQHAQGTECDFGSDCGCA